MTELMNKLLTTALVAAGAALWWLPALALQALEEDQVRGEIVEVNTETGELSLRIAATGDERPEREGEVETYRLDDDAVIRRGTVGRSIADPITLQVGDLGPGDEVVLNFEEVEGERRARDVTVSEREQTEAAPFERDDAWADEEAWEEEQ